MASGGTFAFQIAVLILLLICSALISGAEVAFFGLSATDLKDIIEKKTTQGGIIERLLDRPKKLLATILIANNAINIGVVLLFSDVGETLFVNVDIEWVRFVLEVVVATFLILMFGEILPKVYANRNRVAFAHFMSFPLKVLDVILLARFHSIQ